MTARAVEFPLILDDDDGPEPDPSTVLRSRQGGEILVRAGGDQLWPWTLLATGPDTTGAAVGDGFTWPEMIARFGPFDVIAPAEPYMAPPRPGRPCTCGSTSAHTLFVHDRAIADRAERAVGEVSPPAPVTTLTDAVAAGALVVEPGDALILNHGARAYPLRHDEVTQVRARLDEVAPGLGARTVVAAVQDVVVIRDGARPDIVEQSRQWRAQFDDGLHA